MLTPREKSPLPEKNLLRGGSNPRHCISKTASPTHYQEAIPAQPVPLIINLAFRLTLSSSGPPIPCQGTVAEKKPMQVRCLQVCVQESIVWVLACLVCMS